MIPEFLEALKWIANRGGRTQSLPRTQFGTFPLESLDVLVLGGFLVKADPDLKPWETAKPWWKESVWQITEKGPQAVMEAI